MNKKEKLQVLSQQFFVVGEINLDTISSMPLHQQRTALTQLLEQYYQPVFQKNERLIFVTSHYDQNLLVSLQQTLNRIDISNYFCIILGPGKEFLDRARSAFESINVDPVAINVEWYAQEYDYNSTDPIKINLHDLSETQKQLLTTSKTFCIYPWIHLHAYPTGEAWPCCHADMAAGSIGNAKKSSLEEIWNGDRMRELRCNMLNEKQDSLCVRCYEVEDSGFFSGRQSANKHHGHHVNKVSNTKKDGTVTDFQMTYWDIRFSNLCNLSCRSCGHIFSSSWYQDQVKLAGPEWAKNNRPLNIAGRSPTDMWEQLLPHLDYVEQIYFAGGEPLMMDEHYRILDELERRGRFDVRLIYNTNFTQTKLKDRYVFDYWRKFKSVAVGASLDAMGPRAEYIRKGTDWAIVEENRRRMIDTCPDVDFYISPTLSIMNAWHLPDFHRDWIDKGLIRPQDLNVNILQDPPHYRIDIAPIKYKQRLRLKFEEHLAWLRPLDRLNRATVGFESAIKFMMSIDNTHLLSKFWNKTNQLDSIRNEKLLDVIPELEALSADPTR